jgi:hypothetical protein
VVVEQAASNKAALQALVTWLLARAETSSERAAGAPLLLGMVGSEAANPGELLLAGTMTSQPCPAADLAVDAGRTTALSCPGPRQLTHHGPWHCQCLCTQAVTQIPKPHQGIGVSPRQASALRSQNDAQLRQVLCWLDVAPPQCFVGPRMRSTQPSMKFLTQGTQPQADKPPKAVRL